jgi:Ras of Complex, Roc, domain of DAPkinase/Leucine rich repeat
MPYNTEIEKLIEVARDSNATVLNLSKKNLSSFPESICQLAQLQNLDLSGNNISEIPESICKLKQLKSLFLSKNNLVRFPESVSQLEQLQSLDIRENMLSNLSESIYKLSQLRYLNLSKNLIDELPNSIGQLGQLKYLKLFNNKLKDIPESIVHLKELQSLDLNENPLNLELEAAYKNGIKPLIRYLTELNDGAIVLNEAKLILIGEGGVGKSCLLDALCAEEFVERSSTHGIEIKSFPVINISSNTIFTLNAWDFGGQEVYRPTHQLFFSAPAVYLVVWKPREGIQAGQVKEWISLIKHRAPEAKILIVATHGGPGQRQPDIDRQELLGKFGSDTIVGFFHVDSQPPNYNKDDKNTWLGDGVGITDLRSAIADVTSRLPEVGRRVPKKWQAARIELQKMVLIFLFQDLKKLLKS